VQDALICTSRTADRQQFIASLESAVHQRALARAEVPALIAALPQRFATLACELDFGAESGLETIARLRIGPLAKSVQTQVEITGIGRNGRRGRVDLLINGWLVIELDGDEFHDPAQDRIRDAVLVRLGYRVHRFGYDQIMHHWPLVEATIIELLQHEPARV
jgi:hypothetical protein